MENTTYDQIYECFLENCGYDFSELPQTDERRYSLINNAVSYYNQKARKYEGRIQGDINCDDILECLNVKLNSTELMILANIIALIFSKNKLVEFSSVYGVFAKEMGLKNYQAQVSARQYIIDKYEREVARLIEDEIDTFTI